MGAHLAALCWKPSCARTRVGMLDLYWDLHCPECRGVAGDYARLNDVHALSHCNTCQIDFRVNFDHNVEVIFRPNQSVRTVDATVEFCVGSPQRQPHIAFSTIVPPRSMKDDIPCGRRNYPALRFCLRPTTAQKKSTFMWITKSGRQA
jgi:hypothetical protein